MGMSKGQKRRMYGSRTEAPTTPAPSGRPPTSPDRAAGTPQNVSPSNGSRANRSTAGAPVSDRPPQKSSAGVIIGALVVVSILMFVFLHAWVLPRLQAGTGAALPEFHPLGFAAHADDVARDLGEQGRAAYSSVHWSWGFIAPLFAGVSWVALIAVSSVRRRQRWVLWAAPVLFAIVFVAGNVAADAALAAPGGPAPGVTTVLVLARWVLIVVMIAEAVWLATRLVRGKFDAFSRGELEGQRPVR